MTKYEYKVVPAPSKGGKFKGVKGTSARFAHTLMELMNELGQDGWEYQRTDTLPCEERTGLTGRSTSFQNVLIFRRFIEEEFEPFFEDASVEGDAPPVVAAPVQDLNPVLSTPSLYADKAAINDAPELGPALATDKNDRAT